MSESSKIQEYLARQRRGGRFARQLTEIAWPGNGTVRIDGQTYSTLREVRCAVEGKRKRRQRPVLVDV